MKITFFHQMPLLIDYQGHSLPAKFAAGVEGPIDAKTGMIINLVDLQKAMDSSLPPNRYLKIDKPQTFLAHHLTLIKAFVSKLNLSKVKVTQLQLSFFDPARAVTKVGGKSFHREICYHFDGHTVEIHEQLLDTLNGGMVDKKGSFHWLWNASEEVAQKI